MFSSKSDIDDHFVRYQEIKDDSLELDQSAQFDKKEQNTSVAQTTTLSINDDIDDSFKRVKTTKEF